MKQEQTLNLPARFFRNDTPDGVPCREENFEYQSVEYPLPVQQTALVLIDVWNVHHIDSYVEREEEAIRQYLLPALAAARQAGVTVVHAPSPRITPRYDVYGTRAEEDEPAWPPPAFRARSGEYEVFAGMWPGLWKYWNDELQARVDLHPLVHVEEGDVVIEDGEQLHQLCTDRGILHLLFAGFAATHCILNRNYGIRPMRLRGYNTVLLREATTGIEYPDTVEDLQATQLAIREVETQHGASASVGDFITACEALQGIEAA